MSYTFINWEDIPTNKTTGVTKTTCPNCSHKRKNKKDPCLYVRLDEGVAKCFHCEALSFRDHKDYNDPIYELPSQDYNNYTQLSDKMVKFLESRGISQMTAIHFRLTEEKHYIPKVGKERNCLVFNYFEGDKLVSKKYRDGQKNFMQSANTKNIFYNINSIIGEEECWIVEGEFDVLAMYEAGIKNCISVPNGANDNDRHWIESKRYLQGVERFIIATDNDEKGIELREKIAKRLGRYKCKFVEWKGKDANDDLQSGDIEESIKIRKPFPVNGTFTAFDLSDGIRKLYHNGLPDTIYPKHECFGDLKNDFSVMRGQVTVITGIPSHGKSNFNDWYVLNLINDYDMKGSWFSPEHSPMELYHTNLFEKATGKKFWGANRATEEDLERYEKWSSERVYLTSPGDNTPTWDWIMETFKEQMYAYGIDIFVIDAFNKLILPKGDKLDAINQVMTRLTHFAQSNNVCVFLVAHPTKMRKNEDGVYDQPDLYNVSGSADFRNQTHNGYTIHRYFDNDGLNQPYTEFITTKVKFKFQGNMGARTAFQYDVNNGRYFESNGTSPTFDMTTPNQKENSLKVPKTIWDNQGDNLPF